MSTNDQSTFTLLQLPQSAPNDTTATLTEWVKPGSHWVGKGEAVAVAETTKSVFDIEAPAAGYLIPLVNAGAEAAIGQVIAVISAAEATVEQARSWLTAQEQADRSAAQDEADYARMATKKAELLAQRHQIDLQSVPAAGERITEADVQAYITARGRPAAPLPSPAWTDLVDDRFPANRVQRLLIIGGGNGAVQIIDALARLPQQRAVAIVDDNPALQGRHVAGVPVRGAIDAAAAAEWLAAGEFDAAVISISTSIPARERIFAHWKERSIPFANVIHPSSVVGMNVSWGEGNVVMALCHFGACAAVGDNNFLSAYCSIEHHCSLGSHCSFGPGVLTSSRVRIGDRVRFGTGIFIEPGVTVGADAVIASGVAIRQDIPERALLKAHQNYTLRSR